MLVIPPLACAAILFVQRRRDRLSGDTAFAREQGARSAASRRLASGDAAAAIVGYIADRINQPSGTVTRVEAHDSLVDANAPSDLLERVDRLLAQCERSRFAAAHSADLSQESVSEAKACIQGLEKLDWRKARSVHEGKRS